MWPLIKLQREGSVDCNIIMKDHYTGIKSYGWDEIELAKKRQGKLLGEFHLQIDGICTVGQIVRSGDITFISRGNEWGLVNITTWFIYVVPNGGFSYTLSRTRKSSWA